MVVHISPNKNQSTLRAVIPSRQTVKPNQTENGSKLFLVIFKESLKLLN